MIVCPVCSNVNPLEAAHCLRCSVDLAIVTSRADAPPAPTQVVAPVARVKTMGESILGLDAATARPPVLEVRHGLPLRLLGHTLFVAGYLYVLLFIVSLAYVPPSWNSSVKITGQGEEQFVREFLAELNAASFSDDVVGAIKGDTGDFTSVRHDLGASIANAIATALRPLGYVALAPAPYVPSDVPRFVELDSRTEEKLRAEYPKRWEPITTIPGLVLAAVFILLVIDTGRSLSEGRSRAARELVALTGTALLAASFVAAYGPLWIAAVLLAFAALLALATVTVHSERRRAEVEV